MVLQFPDMGELVQFPTPEQTREEGDYLIIFSPDGKRVLLVFQKGGNWSLPGGKPKPGEKRHRTAERETFEETGLTVKIEDPDEQFVAMGNLRDRLRNKRTSYAFFAVASSDILPEHTSDEIDAIEWHELNNLPSDIEDRVPPTIRLAEISLRESSFQAA